MTADCDALTAEGLLDFAEGRLPADAAGECEAHLRVCAGCRSRGGELLAVADAVLDRKSGWGRFEPPPETIDGAVRERIPAWAEEARKSSRRGAGGPDRVVRMRAAVGVAAVVSALLAGAYLLKARAPDEAKPRITSLRLTDTVELGGEEPGGEEPEPKAEGQKTEGSKQKAEGEPEPVKGEGERVKDKPAENEADEQAPETGNPKLSSGNPSTASPEADSPQTSPEPVPVEPPQPLPASPQVVVQSAIRNPQSEIPSPSPAGLGPGAPPDAPPVIVPPPPAPPDAATGPHPLTPAPPLRRLLRGDVNGDGRVDIADVLLISRALADPSLKIDLSNGDANGDGKVDEKDVLWIQSHVIQK